MSCGQRLIVESVVHHKVQGRTHIRDITFKYFIGIYRNIQTVQVQPIIRFKELADIGIFIFLLFTGRKAKPFKVGKRSRTRGIHHLGAVLAYHRFRLGEKIYVLLFCIHNLFSQLLLNPIIPLLFQFQSQFRSRSLHDTTFIKHMYDVRFDIIQ